MVQVKDSFYKKTLEKIVAIFAYRLVKVVTVLLIMAVSALLGNQLDEKSISRLMDKILCTCEEEMSKEIFLFPPPEDVTTIPVE